MARRGGGYPDVTDGVSNAYGEMNEGGGETIFEDSSLVDQNSGQGFDPDNQSIGPRSDKAAKAFTTLYLTLATILALTAFAVGIATYWESKRNRELAEEAFPSVVQFAHLVESSRLLETSAHNRFVQVQDQLCFLIALQCGQLQLSFQSNGNGIGQLLKVCGDMELQCATNVRQGISNTDYSSYRPGECFNMGGEQNVVAEEDTLFCVEPQTTTFPSIEATGLLPQTPVSRDIYSVPFSVGIHDIGAGQIPPHSLVAPSLSNTFLSNPQLGPMFLNTEKVLIERNIYGVMISFTYNTAWNRDVIMQTYGGGGSGITPDSVLPYDGVAYVSLNTQFSTKIDGHPGSFGRVTTVLESNIFDGLGELYADEEIVVLSGKEGVAGWDISGGLSNAVSRPTITRSFFASATEDSGSSISLVSPSDIHSYIDEDTGKRFFMIAMRDRVEASDPGALYCTSSSDRPTTCGGFTLLDRDALWQSSPASAVSRFTDDGLNNGFLMPTPGEFIVLRERNLIISGSTISQLYGQQDECVFLHVFIGLILDQFDTILPPPSYDYTSTAPLMSEMARISFYRYDNAEYLFDLSSLWVDSGDLLYTSPAETAGPPPTVVDPNHLNDPNLNINPEWKSVTGYMPILIRKAASISSSDVSLYYGIDFYTGGIFAITSSDPNGETLQAQANPDTPPWKLTYVAWLPYIVLGDSYDRPPISQIIDIMNDNTTTDTPPVFLDTQFMPFPTDMKLTNDGRFIFVAAYGLGQVIVYRRKTSDGPRLELCTAVQVTSGQYNQTRIPDKTHPARPGIPIHGGPASLTIDPSNRFLYVSTGDTIDECIFPSASIHGSVLMRFSINSLTCSDQTLVLDPAFLVTSFDLPANIASVSGNAASPSLASTIRGLPARFGEITFPTGDLGSSLLKG